MVDRNVENNEEILLAQIDLTGCPSGKILDYRDPDKRLQEEFFDCWQNPLEWGPKQGKGRAGRRVGQKSRTPGVRRAAVRWAGGSDCRLEHIRDLRKTARSPRVPCHLEDGIEYGA